MLVIATLRLVAPRSRPLELRTPVGPQRGLGAMPARNACRAITV
jgi:hypothetical protein